MIAQWKGVEKEKKIKTQEKGGRKLLKREVPVWSWKPTGTQEASLERRCWHSPFGGFEKLSGVQILKGRESQKGQAGGSQKSAVNNFPLTTPQTPDFEEAMEHFAPGPELAVVWNLSLSPPREHRGSPSCQVTLLCLGRFPPMAQDQEALSRLSLALHCF